MAPGAGGAPLCGKCGAPCAYRITQKPGPNHGRAFWICPQCNAFLRFCAPGETAPLSSPVRGRMPMTASSPSGGGGDGRALPSSLGGGGSGGGGGRGAAVPSSSSSSYFLSRLEQGNAIPGGGMPPGAASSGGARASPSKPPAATASGTASAGGGPGGGGGAYQMLGPAVSVEVKLGPLLPAPRFSLQHGFSQRLVEAYKRLPPDKRFYEPATKRWAFPLHAFDEVMAGVKAVPGVAVKPLPPFLAAGLHKRAVTRLLSSLGGGGGVPPPAAAAAAATEEKERNDDEDDGKSAAGGSTQEDRAAGAAAGAPEGEEDVGSLSEEGLDIRLGGRLPGVLRDALKGYQWVGAKFVIRRGGRGLIGDEMGLGKTLQAIACMCYYRQLWPCLVVVPSSVRYQWRDQLVHWMEGLIEEEDVRVVQKGSSAIDGFAVVVISYDLAVKFTTSKRIIPGQFKVVVADESHMLKSPDAQRTRAVVPLLQKAACAVCLSGTPAVSRPAELYMQLHAIQPALFSNWHDFTVRYCNGHQGPFGWDATGASNEAELRMLLETLVMIRRMKKEALADGGGLPPKIREYVKVAVDPSWGVEIDAALKEKESLTEQLKRTRDDDEAQYLNQRMQTVIARLYCMTGQSKVQGVIDYLRQNIFVSSAATATTAAAAGAGAGAISPHDASASAAGGGGGGGGGGSSSKKRRKGGAAGRRRQREDDSDDDDDEVVIILSSSEGEEDDDSDDDALFTRRSRRSLSGSSGGGRRKKDKQKRKKAAAGGKGKKKRRRLWKSGGSSDDSVEEDVSEAEEDEEDDSVEEDSEEEADVMRKRRGRPAGAKRGRAAAGGGGGGEGAGKGKGKKRRESFLSEGEDGEEEELEGLGGGKGMPTEAEKRKWPKVLVFAHHSEVMDLLERGLRGMGVSLIRIDGTTPPQKRHELQTQFQSDPATHAALLSITACAMGLNLTAASVACFAELHWVPGTLFQAEDRIHRLGQTATTVRYKYLISDGTVDRQMWTSMTKKEAVLSTTTGLGENKKSDWGNLQARPYIAPMSGSSGLTVLPSALPQPHQQSAITSFFPKSQQSQDGGGGGTFDRKLPAPASAHSSPQQHRKPPPPNPPRQLPGSPGVPAYRPSQRPAAAASPSSGGAGGAGGGVGIIPPYRPGGAAGAAAAATDAMPAYRPSYLSSPPKPQPPPHVATTTTTTTAMTTPASAAAAAAAAALVPSSAASVAGSNGGGGAGGGDGSSKPSQLDPGVVARIEANRKAALARRAAREEERLRLLQQQQQQHHHHHQG